MTAASKASSTTWSIRDVLEWTTTRFSEKGIPSARLDAEVLLASTLQVDRIYLYAHHDRPLSASERETYREHVQRRSRGEPVAYILGEKEFYGRSFEVTPDVLIPRPETELLVDALLERLASEEEGALLDVGTGSGCIGLTLAAERQRATVVCTDVSEAALEIARTNAVRLGVEDRVSFALGETFAPVVNRRFGAIVSNPPYVATEASDLEPNVAAFEPASALRGGDSGLDIIGHILAAASAHLLPAGWLLVEFGHDQGSQVQALAEEASGLEVVEIRRDLQGHARLLIARAAQP